MDADKFFGTREKVGTNYMDRAMGVYMGIFGNVSKISVYLSTPTDANGQPLDGSKTSYTVTFPKGQLPPVDYFWSITMYKLPPALAGGESDQALLDRQQHARNEDQLRRVADDLRIGHVARQGQGIQLAASTHAGPFWTVLRTYGPVEPAILDGTYKKPDYVATPLN